MAIIFVNKGAFASGAGALTVAQPASTQVDDLLLLMVESANEAIATPSGWTEVADSPQFTGTAAAAGGVRLAVFYKWDSGAEGSVSVGDTGNHQTAIISAYRGVDKTTPFCATAGSTQAATTSMVWPSITTTGTDCMVVMACAQDTDANSTATSGTPNLSLLINLSATAAAQTQATASLQLQVPLSGAALAQASASGSLSVTVILSAAALASAQADGQLALDVQLAAGGAAAFLATAALDVFAQASLETSPGYAARSTGRRWCATGHGLRRYVAAANGRRWRAAA